LLCQLPRLGQLPDLSLPLVFSCLPIHQVCTLSILAFGVSCQPACVSAFWHPLWHYAQSHVCPCPGTSVTQKQHCTLRLPIITNSNLAFSQGGIGLLAQMHCFRTWEWGGTDAVQQTLTSCDGMCLGPTRPDGVSPATSTSFKDLAVLQSLTIGGFPCTPMSFCFVF
jgi:hypothetical protein